MRPLKIRYGIGIGNYNGDFNLNGSGLTGPIFWNAHDALDSVTKSKAYDGIINSTNPVLDDFCNHILELLSVNLNLIKNKQWEALKLIESGHSYKETSEILEISLSNVYGRVNKSNIKVLKTSFRSIVNLLKKRDGIEKCLI